MNHFQKKLIKQCQEKGLSIQQTYESLQVQRDLCKKMVEHQEECFGRKVWKKSVMVVTNYGGSQKTSREDVLYQLKSMESSFLYSCTPSEVTMFTNMVFWSLEEGVPSSMRFLQYFRKLFNFALKYKDEVFFLNPLTGFPVALRVRERESKDYVYKVGGRNAKVVLQRETQQTNRGKTTSSTIPSVIHSLDAAILIIIKQGLMEEDMAFIHDSIAVHPNNMGKAKEAVQLSLEKCLNSDAFNNIVEQVLEGIPRKRIPKELLTPPFEGTWDGDLSGAENAFS